MFTVKCTHTHTRFVFTFIILFLFRKICESSHLLSVFKVAETKPEKEFSFPRIFMVLCFYEIGRIDTANVKVSLGTIWNLEILQSLFYQICTDFSSIDFKVKCAFHSQLTQSISAIDCKLLIAL